MKKLFAVLMTVVMLMGIAPMLSQRVSALSEPMNMYIRIDGLEGESQDARHNRWIDVIDFKQELSKEDDYSRETTVTLTISHYIDAATSKIISNYQSARRIGEVNFESTKNIGGAQTVVYSVNVKNAVITSETITTDADSQLVETFTLTGTLA